MLRGRARRLADVGCGDGAFVKACLDRGIQAVGYDIVAYDNWGPECQVSPAWQLPLIDKSVDTLTAFDVLEHIYEDDLKSVLDEWLRVTRYHWIFSICTVPAIHSVDGINLHPTVHEKQWWIRLLSKYGRVKMEGHYYTVKL